jgi:hypothetical protein
MSRLSVVVELMFFVLKRIVGDDPMYNIFGFMWINLVRK